MSFYPHQDSRRFVVNTHGALVKTESGLSSEHFPYGNRQRLSEPVVDYIIFTGEIVGGRGLPLASLYPLCSFNLVRVQYLHHRRGIDPKDVDRSGPDY